MKKQFLFFVLRSAVWSIILLTSVVTYATNPPITNNMINLSEGITQYGIQDQASEMVVDGNTIHTIWIQFEYNNSVKLFYRRSTDLGETWEAPIELYDFLDQINYAGPESRRLAVDNGVVHICIPDYDYYNDGTGKLFYIRSTNGGASFEPKVELVNTGGGYNGFNRSYIKAANGKVAIAYNGKGSQNGTRLLYSYNGGNSFTETLISEESNNVTDLWFEGTQIIVLHDYTYYFYGLNTGRVWVSISNDNGYSFQTTKISILNDDDTERCWAPHDQHYAPKIAKSGNNIHIIFMQMIDNGASIRTPLYVRSTDNGASFRPAVDINNGTVGGTHIQTGQETIAAKGNYVYITYLQDNAKAWLVRSANNGGTLTTPVDVMTADTYYLTTVWWPILTCSPSDESGQTVYFGGGSTLLRKSTDGGESFSNSFYIAPILDADIKIPQLQIDHNEDFHWLVQGRWHYTYDYDIFYGNKKPQPNPGLVNKALSIETAYSPAVHELVIVPSSESLQFGNQISGEVWVKLLPGCASDINIFAKINGYDGALYQPSGFNLAFDYNNGGFWANSGIQTEQGQFINWSGGEVADNLWHHMAFTYDAEAVPNNFKTYLDGLLVGEQTVTGEVVKGDGLLMIGSRLNIYGDTKYELDDIRIWDKALTQEEIIENMNNTLTGNEEGLVLFLDFDDTFKDLSGHGNDAIPLYLGNLDVSNFDPPHTQFNAYQTVNEVTFTNATQNADTYFWNFGDEQTSEEGFPTHVYANPGEYHVSLTSKNDNSVTSDIGHVTIEGLHKVEPTEAGNIGYATIRVFGGGLTIENTSIELRKSGEENIEGTQLNAPKEGVISGLFYLQEKTTGTWDVVVTHDGAETVLPGAFEIIEGEAADPWAHVLGQGFVLFNTWTTYTVEYGNNGNVDALGVPLWLIFTDDPGFDIEFVDIDIVEPPYNEETGYTIDEDSVAIWFIAENYFGEGKNGRVYPLYFPVIPANSSQSFHIRIKTSGDLELESWVSDPWYSGDVEEDMLWGPVARDGDVPFSEMNFDARACIMLTISKAIAENLIDLVIPTGCISAIITPYWNPFDYKPKSTTKPVPTLGSTVWSLVSLVATCAGDISYFKAYKVATKLAGLAASIIDGSSAISKCRDAWNKKSKEKRNIGAVSSFDPNEIMGPDGYGDNNYMKLNNVIPYLITFENKSDATAPAHTVRISDTLDLTKFDLSAFGFGSFGFGDTIISLSGTGLTSYSVDIDLRPDIPVIARASGTLDETTGIITWEFYSLDPSTMMPVEDPFIGFLPPNISPPEGEGFVSYHVGLKQNLTTNTEIKNQAVIIFDANEPIVTNEYKNVLDIDVPESHVSALSPEMDQVTFTVSWTGNDVGSGINTYSVWVLVNDTLLTPWKVDETGTSAQFTGKTGYNYKFYSIARDNVSWIEDAPYNYDAETTVVGITEVDDTDAWLLVFPNPAKGKINLRMKRTSGQVYEVEMQDVVGKVIYHQSFRADHLSKGISIDLNTCHSGTYILRVTSEDKSYMRKIVVW